MAGKIRVAVVDRTSIVTKGLRSLFTELAPDLGTAVCANSWSDLLTEPGFPVDVVIINADLNDGIPLDLKIATLMSTGARVVVMSDSASTALVHYAIRAHALGFLLKNDDVDEFLAAIRAVAANTAFISEGAQALMARSDAKRYPKLSIQERRVIEAFIAPNTASKVASMLNITESTVYSYIKSGRAKFTAVGIDAGDKVSLRRHAIAMGMTPTMA